MDRFTALGRGAQMMLVAGVLLLIDLLFLSWQEVEVAGVDIASRQGFEGFAGVVLLLLTLVLLAWLVVRLASVNIALPVSTAMTGALLGTLILIFAIIKILTILGDATTIWAWIGLALAVVIAVGAFQVVQEAGGVEQLKTEIPSMPPPKPSTTQAPPPPTQAPPAAPSQETAPPPPAGAPSAEAPSEQAPPTSETTPPPPIDEEERRT